MRRSFVLLAFAGISVGATPAFAQTATGEFSYSPEAQERGKAVVISGKCSNGGDTTLRVTAQQGAAGDGSYIFTKTFAAAESGVVNGSIEVPDDAPFGPYVMTGECFAGTGSFFRKDGSFSVVENASATTTTAPRVTTTTTSSTTSSTTSTTVADATASTTSTTEVEITFGPPDDSDTTSTTVDEFAGK